MLTKENFPRERWEVIFRVYKLYTSGVILDIFHLFWVDYIAISYPLGHIHGDFLGPHSSFLVQALLQCLGMKCGGCLSGYCLNRTRNASRSLAGNGHPSELCRAAFLPHLAHACVCTHTAEFSTYCWPSNCLVKPSIFHFLSDRQQTANQCWKPPGGRVTGGDRLVAGCDKSRNIGCKEGDFGSEWWRSTCHIRQCYMIASFH